MRRDFVDGETAEVGDDCSLFHGVTLVELGKRRATDIRSWRSG